MGYCPSCGATTNAGATFCHACGAPLTTHAPAPASGATAVHPSQRVRPVGVSIIGFVTVAFSAIAIVVGLFLMIFMGALGAFVGGFVPGDGGAFAAFFGALGLFVAVFVFAFAALGIFVGIGVLRGSGWAWIAMLILMGLNALGGLSSLASRDVGGVVSLIVSGLVIWYFFQPDVKAWFGRA